MQKSTWARTRGMLAFGALMIAGVQAQAQSGVTLYGQVDAFVGMTRAIGAADSAAVMVPGGMQTNFWGLRGTEELGGGMSAIFALEAFYRMDTGAAGRFTNDALFSRSAYVGLQNRFGTIQLGRNTTPYWLSTIGFNPYAGSFSFSPSIMHSYGPNGTAAPPLIGDSGWNNSLLYVSPSFGGFTARLQYAFGEAPGESGKNKYGGNIVYASGPFSATVAYQSVDFSVAPGDLGPAFQRQRALLAGASYDFKVVRVFAQYQRLKNDLATGDITRNGGQLGVSIPAGPGAILASYGYTRTTGAADARRNSWAVGYDYRLSKRTDIYANYFRDKIDGSGEGSGYTYGLGVRHYF